MESTTRRGKKNKQINKIKHKKVSSRLGEGDTSPGSIAWCQDNSTMDEYKKAESQWEFEVAAKSRWLEPLVSEWEVAEVTYKHMYNITRGSRWE